MMFSKLMSELCNTSSTRVRELNHEHSTINCTVVVDFVLEGIIKKEHRAVSVLTGLRFTDSNLDTRL